VARYFGISTHIETINYGVSVKGISINGLKLHDINMPLVPYKCGVVATLRYPKERIDFEYSKGEAKLTVPTRLGVEMYRIGVLPQDENQTFPICISGKSIGSYRVVNFLYPNDHSDFVIITLQR
jgi:hypothetical protein